MTPRPQGYREPTDEEMKCLPEGVLGLGFVGDEWQPISWGKPAVFTDKDIYAVPITDEVSHSGIVRKAPMVEAPTGAKREDKAGRGAFHLIPPMALRSLARRFEDGAVHHGENNWQKGIPLSSYFNAVNRHALQAAEGETDEDHFGAALWNLSAWMWTENEIKAGRLPTELDDLPYRTKKP